MEIPVIIFKQIVAITDYSRRHDERRLPKTKATLAWILENFSYTHTNFLGIQHKDGTTTRDTTKQYFFFKNDHYTEIHIEVNPTI